MIAPIAAPAYLYGTPDGSGAGAGIEALGLCVQIEVGRHDMVVSASLVDGDAWCEAPLDQRLPELIRTLIVMMQLRTGGQPRPELVRAFSLMMQPQWGGETPPQHRKGRRTKYVFGDALTTHFRQTNDALPSHLRRSRMAVIPLHPMDAG